MRVFCFFLLFCVCYFPSPTMVSAQSQESSVQFRTRGVYRAPIQLRPQDHVALVEADGLTLRNGYQGGRYVLVNRSPVPMVAGVIIIWRQFGDQSHHTVHIFDARLLPGASVWEPGENHAIDQSESSHRSETGQPTGVEIEIDYLEFADGTYFGKNGAGKKDYIEHRREGARMALAHLDWILRKDGVEAVLQLIRNAREERK